MTIEELKEKCKEVQQFAELDTTDFPASELVARLSMVNSYLATTSYMLAVAKKLQDIQAADIYNRFGTMIMKMPATVATKFISSQTYEINYIVNWLERLNRCLVHQGDNTRTQVSFEKESLRLTKTGY